MTSRKRWLKNLFTRTDAPEAPAEAKGAPEPSGDAAPSEALAPTPQEALFTSPFALFREHPFFQRSDLADFWRDPGSFFGDLDSWFGDHRTHAFRPHVDVTDAESHLVVSAELPGMSEKDVIVEVRENMLTIRGEKRHEESSEERGCYRIERSYGAFERTIPLPNDVDTENVNAMFNKGVLSIRLPKTESRATGRRIPVITK